MEDNMNRDGFIKRKFREDNYISEQANDVFDKFKNGILSKQINSENQRAANKNNVVEFANTGSHNQQEYVNYGKSTVEANDNSKNSSISNITSIDFNKTANNNANRQLYTDSEHLFYKRMNKILSIAAVSLCALVVGTGTMLFNRKPQVENIDIITKSVTVRNEELRFSTEQVVKEHENNLVKASLIGNNEVAIQLKKEFINFYNLNLSPDKQYKVNNINKKVKDVFVGNIVSNKLPYVMLLMEDGTAEYVRIIEENGYLSNNYEFNFYSQGIISGLYNVVGFEQNHRNYSYSSDSYYYINAIREDGRKKEIEIGYYNDWENTETKVYNKLNQKYIDEYEESQNRTTKKNAENTNITDREKAIEEIKKCLKDKKWVQENVMMKQSCFENVPIQYEQKLTFMTVLGGKYSPMVIVQAYSEKDTSNQAFIVSYQDGNVQSNPITEHALHNSHAAVSVDPNNAMAVVNYMHMGYFYNTLYELKNGESKEIRTVGGESKLDENGNEVPFKYFRRIDNSNNTADISEEEYNKLSAEFKKYKFYPIGTDVTDDNIDLYIK